MGGRFVNRRVFLGGLAAAIVYVCGSAAPPLNGQARGADRASASPSDSPTVREYLAHQLSGSGVWRQDNPAFTPGGDQPRFWERVVRPGPDPHIVTADAFAVTESGSCQAIVHIVYWWNEAAGAVVADAFGAVRTSGRLVRVKDVWALEVTGQLPDGTALRFRDVPGSTRPDAYSTIGYQWNGKDWVRQDEATWHRAAKSAC